MREALSRSPHRLTRTAVLLTDAGGSVRLCNRAASRMLGCKASSAVGRPCWQVARFSTPRGSPFCSVRCPIQRLARRGTPEPRDRIVEIRRGDSRHQVRLTTFLVSPGLTPRCPVLHLLAPLPRIRAAERARDCRVKAIRRLERLSCREWEVLRLLASGLDTAAIAETLFICPVTVRNHVQSILGKLDVHRRVEAILALRQSGNRR